jgi:hypothetical protein
MVLGVVSAQDDSNITDGLNDADTQTCNGYFKGYVYYSDANACKLEETSGCDNPYEFSSREECERVNGISFEDKGVEDRKPQDDNSGFRDLDGCRNNCKSVCDDEECRSKCIGKCKNEYGSENGRERNDFNGKHNGDCEQVCFDKAAVIMPSCPGEMKALGSYPDCDCEWVCDNDYDFEELEEEYEDEEIKGAGITPDSAFYFLDN